MPQLFSIPSGTSHATISIFQPHKSVPNSIMSGHEVMASARISDLYASAQTAPSSIVSVQVVLVFSNHRSLICYLKLANLLTLFLVRINSREDQLFVIVRLAGYALSALSAVL